jgi:hypothetical protein
MSALSSNVISALQMKTAAQAAIDAAEVADDEQFVQEYNSFFTQINSTARAGLFSVILEIGTLDTPTITKLSALLAKYGYSVLQSGNGPTTTLTVTWS